jgi:hypothetical protein
MASLVPTVPVEGEFRLGTDGVISISVLIGELQQGFTIVMLDDVELVSGARVIDHQVGTAESLRGKTLWVDTTVTVTNPQTTRTSVRLVVDDGSDAEAYSAARQLNAIGDSVIYEGRITLT